MISQISPRLRHAGYGFTEDNFMHMMMLDTGSSNRTRYVQEMALPMHLAIQTGNASVMRGGLVPGDFRGRNWNISTNQVNEERLMEVHHPQWHDIVRVFGNRARRFERDDEADVLSVTDEKITLKWDCWGVEAFKRWRMEPSICRAAADRKNLFLPGKSGCPVYSHRALYDVLG